MKNYYGNMKKFCMRQISLSGPISVHLQISPTYADFIAKLERQDRLYCASHCDIIGDITYHTFLTLQWNQPTQYIYRLSHTKVFPYFHNNSSCPVFSKLNFFYFNSEKKKPWTVNQYRTWIWKPQGRAARATLPTVG